MHTCQTRRWWAHTGQETQETGTGTVRVIHLHRCPDKDQTTSGQRDNTESQTHEMEEKQGNIFTGSQEHEGGRQLPASPHSPPADPFHSCLPISLLTLILAYPGWVQEVLGGDMEIATQIG